MKILITGSAGFIGFHTAKFFLNKGHHVVGVDNINHYYDIKLKIARNNELKKFKNYSFKKVDITSTNKIKKIFLKNKFNLVIHLAAQAGVRYSLVNPRSYIETNLIGFFNIIENCKIFKIKNLIYASSSSIYGESTKKKFKETDPAVSPIQLYAATKRSNELMAHAYSSLYKIKTIGLRFFTVYGPWGRPDMSLFLFTKKILNNEKINVFNKGIHRRDFTYVDDIVNGIYLCAKKLVKKSSNKNIFEVVNIARGQSVKLKDFISIIEKKLKIKAKKRYKDIQKGDVVETAGSIEKIKSNFGYKPTVSIDKGVEHFIDWYKKFYKK